MRGSLVVRADGKILFRARFSNAVENEHDFVLISSAGVTEPVLDITIFRFDQRSLVEVNTRPSTPMLSATVIWTWSM